MRAATSGDPNYFPNDADEGTIEEESEDSLLVENEPVIGGVAVDEENVFDHDHDENNGLEDMLARKSHQKQAHKMLKATKRRYRIILDFQV